jgi:hypothetical protein
MDPKGSYVASADWAKEQDYTVITVMRVDKHPYTLCYYLRLNRRPYPVMIEYFNNAINDYNAYALHDATGLGNVVSDYLDTRAQKFLMTGIKRDNMLSEYVSAVENGDFKFPKIPSMYLAHKYAQVGDLYSRGQDYHLPDEVCAAALANHHARKNGLAAPPAGVPKDNKPNKYQQVFEAHTMPNQPPAIQGQVQIKDATTGGISLLV